MARREAFIAKVTIDLEHPLHATHHQSLEIEFRRDTKGEIHIERIVMRDKWARRRAPGNDLHHRRFDFEIATLAQEAANVIDGLRAYREHAARFMVGDQIEISLAIAHLLVDQAMELLWQRAQRFGEQA